MDIEQTTTQRSNILVVDDIPANVQFLAKLLIKNGYEVRSELSGHMALAAIDEVMPALILLDARMPGMSGYEVCKALKANPKTREIPVIFLSSLDEVLDKIKAFEVGAVDYITKPFHFAELLARVQTHLMLRRLQQQLQAQNEQLHREIRDRIAAETALQFANQELKRLAHLDGLTQVANRRCFDERLEYEWHRLAREQQPLSLILCDVDYFKLYNDHYGHQAGDACLQKIAEAINRNIRRAADLVARYGGEEFVIILPNTSLRGAVYVTELIRTDIAALKIPHLASPLCDWVTASIGLASIIPSLDRSPRRLVDAADQALYEAKFKGRDRYTVYDIHSFTES
jgi:diguanylate cyclase (GGDEF)-like protein